MHTATQLSESLFAVRLAGQAARRDDVFEGWTPRDRFGIIVHEPFGGVGASHLIQLAITAFYDVQPSRRDTEGTGPRGEPLAQYADVYLFHVGGAWGDHSYFDIWPSRKEPRVGGDPRDVLDAVLDRAITWLAVPEANPVPAEFFRKDLSEAHERIRGAFAYSPTGRVADADVEVSGLKPITEFNGRQVLYPDAVIDRLRRGQEAELEVSTDPGLRRRDWDMRALERAGEAHSGLVGAQARRQAVLDGRTATETYRRIPVDDALHMLVPASG